MTNTTSINATRVIRDILSRNPKASLHEIRSAHPIFQSMSLDQLGVRLGQVLSNPPAICAK